ncbi:MAG: polysaccharide deacetylase family protein [Oscillospiraceae bacterium]
MIKYIVKKGKRYLLLCLVLLLIAGCIMGGILGTAAVQTIKVITGERYIPIYSVETAKKQISLGINCAWNNEDIAQILDTLKQYNVKATFFILGEWCDKYPESVEQIYNAGHEIASHSNTHNSWDTLSKEALVDEITQGMSKLEQLTGKKPQLVRPPSGAYNNLSVSTAEEMGYYVIQWDCDSLDWQDLTADKIVERISNKAAKGSITLLHSGAKHTAEALPKLIEELQKDGFEIVPIGEMIYKDNYTIDYSGRQHSNR